MPIPQAAPPQRLSKVFAHAQTQSQRPVVAAKPLAATATKQAHAKTRVTVTADQLIVRPATALDAVNIYKGLRSEEERRVKNGDLVPEYDETAKIAHILTTIATGYVVVVELSGRIIGSLGFVNGAQGYEKKNKLSSTWGFLVHAIRREDVVSRIIATVVAFANKVETRVEVIVDKEFVEFWENSGFESGASLLVYNGEEPQVDEPDFTDGGPGSDNPDNEFEDKFHIPGAGEEEELDDDDATDPLYGPRGSKVDDDLDSELDDDEQDAVPSRPAVEPRLTRPRTAKV